MHIQDENDQAKPGGFEIIFHGVTWGLVGALYAALFVPVFEVIRNVLPLWVAPICATIAATVGGALVYSSSQLALLVAIFSNFAVFAYLLYSGETASPLAPILVGAGIGTAVGAAYGLSVKGSRIHSAEAKLFAGTVVGSALSILSLVWILVFDASIIILIAILAPVAGMLYVRIVNQFIERYSDVLPPFADGAVAGMVIGGFIGFGLWIFGGTALENATPEWQDTIAGIGGSAPLAVAAASASTLVLGMLHEGFRSRSN